MPGGGQPVGHGLRRLRRDGDDADADRLVRDDPLELVDVAHDEVADPRCRPCAGSLSKIADDDEPVLAQPVVARDRRAEVARADEREPVRVVGAEDLLDAVDRA